MSVALAMADDGMDDGMESLADRIANLTLKEAVQLSKYLEEVHGLKPAQPTFVPEVRKEQKVVEQTEFDVVLESFNDAKLAVVKEIKAITAATLMDAKKMVESCPVTIKAKAYREEAEKIQKQLQAVGATVSIR